MASKDVSMKSYHTHTIRESRLKINFVCESSSPMGRLWLGYIKVRDTKGAYGALL